MKYLGILLLFVAIVITYRLRRSTTHHAASDLDALMIAHADDAVRRAEDEFAIRLDFSADSVRQVEAILGRLHERHRQEPLGEVGLGREARLWGAYLGAVIKRLRHGTWRKDSAAGGEGSLPLVFGKQDETFPCAWAYKRIANGDEDNVAVKFQLLILDRDKGPEGLGAGPD
jgi:hypothetical protein